MWCPPPQDHMCDEQIAISLICPVLGIMYSIPHSIYGGEEIPFSHQWGE